MTKPISPNTSIYQWNNYLLMTVGASFPLPAQIKEMDFKSHIKKIVPKGYRVSEFFTDVLGFSRLEFNRKLKEGAVCKGYYGFPWKKLNQDEIIEKGDTDYRIGRLVACIWRYDTKHTFKWYLNYFLLPIYAFINKITGKVLL